MATPHPSFGELLRISLEESGQYRVRLVQTANEATQSINRAQFSLAILDSDLSDQPLAWLSKNLVAQNPNLKIILIPPENNPKHPSLSGIAAQGFLNRPFYLPDLIQMVEEVLKPVQQVDKKKVAPETKPKPTTPSQRPAWMEDVNLAGQHLNQLLLESSAHVAMITRSGKVWATAGNFSQESAQETVVILNRYWNAKGKSDLVRFVHYESNSGDYMLYATALIEDLILALVYDNSMPLTRVHTQASTLVRLLMNSGQSAQTIPPSTSKPVESKPTVSQPLPPPPDPRLTRPAPGPQKPPSEPIRIEIPSQAQLIPEEEEYEGQEESEPISLSQLLADMPPPNPEKQSKSSPAGWSAEAQTTPVSQSNPVFPWESGWQPPQAAPETQVQQPLRPAIMPIFTEAPAVESGLVKEEEPGIDPLADTRPTHISSRTQPSKLEPVQAGFCILDYTCVLLPRLPNHFLTGDLAQRMNQWLPQICLSYGWRLEGLAVRPAFLQWTVQLSPMVAPGRMELIIRQQLSQRIFGQFMNLKTQNPSGDYWAPGYLIISGSHPPSTYLLRDFVTQTRRRQGIPVA